MIPYYCDRQLVGGEVLEMAWLSDAVIGCLVGLPNVLRCPETHRNPHVSLPILFFSPCKLSGHHHFRGPELILPSVEQQHPAGAAIM